MERRTYRARAHACSSQLPRSQTMRPATFVIAALILLGTAQPARDVSGRWSMSWQTHSHGIRKSGYLIIRQTAEKLDVVLQGDGELRATGTIEGNAVHIAGRKGFFPFTIE